MGGRPRVMAMVHMVLYSAMPVMQQVVAVGG